MNLSLFDKAVSDRSMVFFPPKLGFQLAQPQIRWLCRELQSPGFRCVSGKEELKESTYEN
jgi:hypothetical protein